jgi:GR25 family glycosyltransferase involved in LPS biosynthesis
MRIGVVAHTSRAEQANDLAGKVGADYIHWDDGTLGCNKSHRETWAHLAHMDSEWTVVLEDDAEPIPEFRHHLSRAITHAPAPIVSLYLGRTRPKTWQNKIRTATQSADNLDAPWIVSTQLLHAVAVAIRTDLLNSMINAIPDTAIDFAIGAWARSTGHRVAYTWPSLVDHHDGDSLVRHAYGRTPRGRTAWRTGTRDTWNQPATVSM